MLNDTLSPFHQRIVTEASLQWYIHASDPFVMRTRLRGEAQSAGYVSLAFSLLNGAFTENGQEACLLPRGYSNPALFGDRREWCVISEGPRAFRSELNYVHALYPSLATETRDRDEWPANEELSSVHFKWYQHHSPGAAMATPFGFQRPTAPPVVDTVIEESYSQNASRDEVHERKQPCGPTVDVRKPPVVGLVKYTLRLRHLSNDDQLRRCLPVTMLQGTALWLLEPLVVMQSSKESERAGEQKVVPKGLTLVFMFPEKILSCADDKDDRVCTGVLLHCQLTRRSFLFQVRV